MFEARERGRLSDAQLTNSNPNAVSVVAARVALPGRNPEDTCGLARIGRAVAPRARSASDDQLQHGPAGAGALRGDLGANFRLIEGPERQPAASRREPIEVMVEPPNPPVG